MRSSSLIALGMIVGMSSACGGHGRHRSALQQPSSNDALPDPEPVDDIGGGDDDEAALPNADTATEDGRYSRRCQASADGVTIRRTWRGDDLTPDSDTALLVDDAAGLGSTRVERYVAGPAFGTPGNIGYSSADGAIVNGAPVRQQPSSIRCSSHAWASLGWQFSNNVSGLRVQSTVRLRTTRTAPDATVTHTLVRGERLATYLDPAGVPPYAASTSSAYFNQDGLVSVVTRSVDYGSARHPNAVRILSHAKGQHPQLQVYSLYTTSPLVERVTRSLDRGWPQVERSLVSGTFTGKHLDGTTTTTQVEDLVYRRDTDGRTTCRPVSGTITIQIVPKRVTANHPSVTVEKDYEDGHDPVSTVSCSKGAKDCIAAAHEAVGAYGPPACLY